MANLASKDKSGSLEPCMANFASRKCNSSYKYPLKHLFIFGSVTTSDLLGKIPFQLYFNIFFESMSESLLIFHIFHKFQKVFPFQLL